MASAEILGFITGAACVYLTLRENIWNFPLGLANNLFFLVLFLHGRLFGDAGLQIVYLILGARAGISGCMEVRAEPLCVSLAARRSYCFWLRRSLFQPPPV